MANSEKDVSIIKSIQTTLASLSLYGGRIDGLFGAGCQTAVLTMIKKAYPDTHLVVSTNSYEASSVFTFLQTLLSRVGLYTIKIDGKWGPSSQAGFDKLTDAYRQALARANGNTTLPVQPATVVGEHITEAQLKVMLPQSSWDKIPMCIDPLNKTMDIFQITTLLRKAHFMAQILHETAFFKYSEEIASGKAYEGRADLGNIHPGDGVLFKGRGWLQITGRDNYLKCQTYLRQHLANPLFDITSSTAAASQLATNPLYAALASGYFWGIIKPKLNASADNDDIYWVSVYVNGYARQAKPYYPNRDKEPNGMKERVEMLALTKKAFGLV